MYVSERKRQIQQPGAAGEPVAEMEWERRWCGYYQASFHQVGPYVYCGVPADGGKESINLL